MKPLLFLIPLTLLIGCGGGRTLPFTPVPYSKATQIPTLASQNRLALHSDGVGFIYRAMEAPPVEPKLIVTGSPPRSKTKKKTDRVDHLLPSQTESKRILNSPTETRLEEKEAAIQYEQATPFTLENHTGKKISLTFPTSQPVVLAIADKDGADQMTEWIQPLYKMFGDQIQIHGIAELSVVPFFARGIAKSIIASQVKDYPVILDWEGQVSKSYRFKAQQSNLYIISQKGEILYSTSGAFNDGDFQDIKTVIGSILE